MRKKINLCVPGYSIFPDSAVYFLHEKNHQKDFIMEVFKFIHNRVLRLYSGGSGIDRLCGEAEPKDTRFPEDWIASCIEGNGRAYHSPGHGISKIVYQGEIRSFPEFLREHALALLGPEHLKRFGPEPAVLTKLLDSAERLPLQVHPTRADAERLFHVHYGKTEAWIVLATRKINGEEPYLLVGFNETFDRETFYRESVKGEYKTGLSMLHKLNVKPGDVVIIRGGLPHAIGPGVTMVEVMEPSDLVIVPEINCCGVMLDVEKRFNGLGIEKGMSLFDFQPRTKQELLEYVSPKPETLEQNENGTLSTLIPRSACGYFEAQKLTFREKWNLDLSRRLFRIGILTEGSARLNTLEIKRGESFMIPYDSLEITITGNGTIVFVLPPEEENRHA